MLLYVEPPDSSDENVLGDLARVIPDILLVSQFALHGESRFCDMGHFDVTVIRFA